jgi:hypothetical protein
MNTFSKVQLMTMTWGRGRGNDDQRQATRADPRVFPRVGALGDGTLTLSSVGCPVADNVCHLAESHQRWNVVLHFGGRAMKNLPKTKDERLR